MPDRHDPVCARRARPPILIPAALATALLVACTGAPPPASTSPGSTPGPTASAAPSPTSPTPSPTAPPSTPTPAPSQAAGAISHPTGPTDVVLRMDEGGGHMMFGYDLTQAPAFTLYGDGTFLLRQIEDPEITDPSQGFPRFLHGQMNEEYVQALLRFALGTGRLLDARADYPHNGCADCSTTTFAINAAGVQKTVSIYALGFDDQGADAADRRGFGELRETIVDLERRAKAGELGEVVVYDPELYRVVVLEGFGEPTAEWPWPQIAPSDFEAVPDGNYRQLVMTRDDVAALVDVPTGGHPGVVVEGEGDAVWQIGIRPLLPDEIETDVPAGD